MLSPTLITFCPISSHRNLTPRQFLRQTRRRYLWARDYTRTKRTRLVGGTCTLCGSDLTLELSCSHNLTLATRFRELARTNREAAVWREYSNEFGCARALRKLARRYERRAVELEELV